MKFFDIDTPLMQTLSRVGDLIIVNFLFLLCCLPVLTIGASAAAMYRVMINLINDTGSGTIASFFQAFRTNLKNATMTFLIMLLPALLSAYELWLYISGTVGYSIGTTIVFLMPLILLMAIFSYAYPLTAQFENGPLRTLKNAALLSIIHLPTTLVITSLNLLPIILALFFTNFFLRIGAVFLTLGFSGIAYIDTMLLLRIFRKYMPKETSEEKT